MRTVVLNLFPCLVLLICFAGCGPNLGEKIVVDGTAVYYDGEQVTKADAEKLGAALVNLQFTDGNEKAVQLQKEGNKNILKMVMKPEYLESGELDNAIRVMCLELSSRFDGAEFECHACDEYMESKKSFTGLCGKLTDYNKAEFYYNSLADEQLDGVKKVLDQFEFTEFEGTLFFGKTDGSYEFRVVCTPEFQQDEGIQAESKLWQAEFSKVLDGESVAILMCDENFIPYN